ncbi:hypothetical protein DYH09_35400, partial [bacterium CPR1]|nr:hypothetical protein [bacterium CPR1]
MGLSEREQELVSALLDGVLEGEELREAEQLIADSTEASRLLEDYRSDLKRLQALPRLKAEPRHRVRLLAARRPRVSPWLKAAVVTLLIGGAVWLWLNRPPGHVVTLLIGGAVWLWLNRPPGHRPLLALFPRLEARLHPGEQPLVHKVENLTGRFAHRVTAFRLRLDGADGKTSSGHLKLSYDFDGDGRFDRQESYFFACDAEQGWQTFTQDAARVVASGDP